MENTQKKQKLGLIKRIDRWWNGLTFNQQLGITVGTWFIAGLSWGSALQQIADAKKSKATSEISYAVGVKDGKAEAYRDIAVNGPQKK